MFLLFWMSYNSFCLVSPNRFMQGFDHLGVSLAVLRLFADCVLALGLGLFWWHEATCNWSWWVFLQLLGQAMILCWTHQSFSLIPNQDWMYNWDMMPLFQSVVPNVGASVGQECPKEIMISCLPFMCVCDQRFHCVHTNLHSLSMFFLLFFVWCFSCVHLVETSHAHTPKTSGKLLCNVGMYFNAKVCQD